MSPAGFEPTIPASQRPQIHALDRAATGIGPFAKYLLILSFLFSFSHSYFCFFLILILPLLFTFSSFPYFIPYFFLRLSCFLIFFIFYISLTPHWSLSFVHSFLLFSFSVQHCSWTLIWTFSDSIQHCTRTHFSATVVLYPTLVHAIICAIVGLNPMSHKDVNWWTQSNTAPNVISATVGLSPTLDHNVIPAIVRLSAQQATGKLFTDKRNSTKCVKPLRCGWGGDGCLVQKLTSIISFFVILRSENLKLCYYIFSSRIIIFQTQCNFLLHFYGHEINLSFIKRLFYSEILGKCRSTLQIWKELTVGVRRVDQEAVNYQPSHFTTLYIPFSNSIVNKDNSDILTRLINYVSTCQYHA
jgi:hypothetical protein